MTARQQHVVLGLGLLLGAAAVWWGVEGYAPAYRWQFVEVDVLSDVEVGLLRGYRSVLALVAIPTLALACLAVLVVSLRRRALSAIVVAGVSFLAANLGVQAVKHLVRPLPVLSRWEEDLHLSGHIGVVVGTAALLLVVLGPRHRGWHGVVGSAIALAAAGILVSGWHSVSEVVASLFVASGTVVLVLATLARPAARLRGLWSPDTVIGAVLMVVPAIVGIRDAGAHRSLAIATSALVVVGAALLAFGLMAPLLVAAVPPEHQPSPSLDVASRSADQAAEVCRTVAAAGAHRHDWLRGVADEVQDSQIGAVLTSAESTATRPAAWLVLRRALRVSGRRLPTELSSAVPSGPWTWVARSADRVAPPSDSAPAGALVRMIAEGCRPTPGTSLAALLRAATAAWRPVVSVRDPAVRADRTG
ncbi:MAG TPA: hypothetical protein VFR40_12545 [Lapillicoccus sp.]|nr:hypothetical protein [Lapillicoccus sp.]